MSRTDIQTIYIARGAVSGLLKIGRTVAVVPRLLGLATKHGETPETLALIRASGMLENRLHRRFAASRSMARGKEREWFNDDGAVRAFVESLPAEQRRRLVAHPRVAGAQQRRGVSAAVARGEAA